MKNDGISILNIGKKYKLFQDELPCFILVKELHMELSLKQQNSIIKILRKGIRKDSKKISAKKRTSKNSYNSCEKKAIDISPS
jgi:hypothetical protein